MRACEEFTSSRGAEGGANEKERPRAKRELKKRARSRGTDFFTRSETGVRKKAKHATALASSSAHSFGSQSRCLRT
ncbi:hypothetical protein AKJ08_2652 [Vulgatibacter incomptus]|uniref:Uncharacterized protein n=1 Tax=Vulgatibacter incomptus TaxID=1391653 RepID=A0A0K1PFH6_9BACT|nr:hypothetical protein AKJ08_2652 [Vulgatibacter incomptus]